MKKQLVYLVQTDTTVGFSSSNDEKLNVIKKRDKNQKILQTVSSLKTLKENTRVPKKYKKLVRNSKKTTFIYPNKKSFRVTAQDDDFFDFIKKFKLLYSTSANENKKSFDKTFAFSHSDIIVENKNGFFENPPSLIIKLSKSKSKILR